MNHRIAAFVSNQRDDSAPKRDRFWERKKLEEMSAEEWELLCDGCGWCCICKFVEPGTGRYHYTSICCSLYDIKNGCCGSYAGRAQKVSNCAVLTPENVREFHWLPATCAYRLIAEGKDLYHWHPLVCGDPGQIHRLGLSARGRVVSESLVPLEKWPEYLLPQP